LAQTDKPGFVIFSQMVIFNVFLTGGFASLEKQFIGAFNANVPDFAQFN
jgi:hypothetical protein